MYIFPFISGRDHNKGGLFQYWTQGLFIGKDCPIIYPMLTHLRFRLTQLKHYKSFWMSHVTQKSPFRIVVMSIFKFTVKILNIRTPERFAVITLKFEQCGFTVE